MATAADEWFILYGIPRVAAKEENDRIFEKFINMSFTFKKAPVPSHVTVASNVAKSTGTIHYPSIAAVDSCGIILLCGYTVIGITYYLCDPWIRRTLGILPRDGGIKCPHSVGLIRNRSDNHLIVAELNPWRLEDLASVRLHCTEDMYDWDEKKCECSNIVDAREWHGDGVLSHEGFLWWFDLSYCILACDPFADMPKFYQIMFPDVPDELPFAWTPLDGDVHRCLKVSDGRLRYVQIHGTCDKPEVSMWTLSSNDPSDAKWTSRLKLPLDKVWDDQTYRDARLRERVIPAVVLVHPMNANEVYFFLDTYIFAIDLTKSKVVDCKEFSISWPPHKTCSSRLVHAWQLPAKLTKISPESGPSWSHAKEIDFVSRWNSVEDFHNKAAMIRSLSKLHDSGLDDEDNGDALQMSEI